MVTPTRVQRAPSLADQVYDVLCERIVSGALKPGDRLVFDELAGEFGVSQTPVRDASIRLARDGLATETASGRLQVALISGEYVRNVYAVRVALEGVAASLAATHMSDAGLHDLQAAFERAAADRELLRPAAKQLHQRIHDAANNPILIRELRVLRTHADYILGYVFRTFGAVYHVSLDEHVDIVAALISRDPQAARHAMEAHMRRAGERIVTLIAEHGQGITEDM